MDFVLKVERKVEVFEKLLLKVNQCFICVFMLKEILYKFKSTGNIQLTMEKTQM